MEESKRKRWVTKQDEDFRYELDNGDENDHNVRTHAIIASVNGAAVGYIMYRNINNQISVKDLYVVNHGILLNNKKMNVGQVLHKKMVILNPHVNRVDLCTYDKAEGFYQKMGYQDENTGSRMKDMSLPKDHIDVWCMTALPPQKRPSFQQYA
ncbi:MAG TPA: hypothetical protein VGF14_04535 [Alphaproteobacteria bacterium]